MEEETVINQPTVVVADDYSFNDDGPVTRETCRDSHEICIEDLPLQAFHNDVARFAAETAKDIADVWFAAFPSINAPDLVAHLMGGHSSVQIEMAVFDTIAAFEREYPTARTPLLYFTHKLALLQIEAMEVWLYQNR